MPATKLVRSSDDQILGGVCAGIADSMGWDANRFRLVYVVVSLLSAAFPGLLVYLALWFLMPEE
ncbi:MAG: PspC domain-containing protein [Planctomycetota bacterium]